MSSTRAVPGRVGRICSRTSCRRKASATLSYVYADSVAILGPLATFAEPHSYDLCELHTDRLTVPNGWSVIRQEFDPQSAEPSESDLKAIADAVRESAVVTESAPSVTSHSAPTSGRRGHLRAVPSSS